MGMVANGRGPYLGDPDSIRPSGLIEFPHTSRTMQSPVRTVVFLCLATLLVAGCDLMGSDGDEDPPPEDDKTVAYVSPHVHP